MHTCIHAYMHTCIHAYMHICTHAYMHTCHPLHGLKTWFNKNTGLQRLEKARKDFRFLVTHGLTKRYLYMGEIFQDHDSAKNWSLFL